MTLSTKSKRLKGAMLETVRLRSFIIAMRTKSRESKTDEASAPVHPGLPEMEYPKKTTACRERNSTMRAKKIRLVWNRQDSRTPPSRAQ
jgi:hypothetical protein